MMAKPAFDELISRGELTNAARLFAKEYYESGKMGHTRKMLVEQIADKVERLQQENEQLTALVEKMKALLKLGLKADGMRWAAEKSGDARASRDYEFLQARFAKGTAELLDGLEATVND